MTRRKSLRPRKQNSLRSSPESLRSSSQSSSKTLSSNSKVLQELNTSSHSASELVITTSELVLSPKNLINWFNRLHDIIKVIFIYIIRMHLYRCNFRWGHTSQVEDRPTRSNFFLLGPSAFEAEAFSPKGLESRMENRSKVWDNQQIMQMAV